MTLASDSFNAREIAAGRITPKHISLLTEAWQAQHGLKPDGALGPQTRHSLETETRTTPPIVTGLPSDQGDAWAGGFDGPLQELPNTRHEIYSTFGDPGTVDKPNKAWAKANIVTVRNLPGVPSKWHVSVHRLAEPYLREALRRAGIASSYKIERLGCWNIRHIQSDSSKPLSFHSWGIAVDINSDDNSAKTATGLVPWSEKWNQLWPRGVDRPFVEAMESAGFTWGGTWGARCTDFAQRAKAISFFDPMHFELRGRAS